jgi:cell division protein FtsL
MTVAQFDPSPLPRRSAGPAAAPAERPEPVARPRHLRVVEAPQPSRRLTRVLTALLVTAVCAGLFAIVALRVLLAQGQGQVDRLEARAAAEQVREQRLRLTVAQLESPASVVAAARQRLGMVPPTTVISLTPAPASAR